MVQLRWKVTEDWQCNGSIQSLDWLWNRQVFYTLQMRQQVDLGWTSWVDVEAGEIPGSRREEIGARE